MAADTRLESKDTVCHTVFYCLDSSPPWMTLNICSFMSKCLFFSCLLPGNPQLITMTKVIEEALWLSHASTFQFQAVVCTKLK